MSLAKKARLCTNSVDLYECSLEFSINNFSLRCEVGSLIVSSFFYSENAPDIKWCLKVHVTRNEYAHKNYISVYLNRLSPYDPAVKAKHTTSLLGVDRQKLYTLSRTDEFDEETQSSGSPLLISLDNDLLNFDKLTLLCEVYFIKKSQSTCIRYLVNTSRNTLGQNLLDKQTFCDVVFKFDEKEIKAHRAALATVSSVFEAMFKNEMAENVNSAIEITDIRHEVFEEMIRFIYTGETNDCQSLREELLYTSDKYNIEALKNACEKLIWAGITEENALHLLVTSSKHSCSSLTSKIINFICRNKPLVNTTEVRKLKKLFENNNALTHALMSVVIGYDITDDSKTNDEE